MLHPPGLATRIIQGARDYQEDDCDFLVLDGDGDSNCDGDAPGMLLVLADGMGGHVAGALASKTAVANFIGAWQTSEAGAADNLDIPARLNTALTAANDALRAQVAADPSLAGMGCTLVGAVIADHALHWLSVGDSPLWLMQGGELQRVNQDHSMAPLLQNLVAAGRMTAFEAAADPRRSALRSAVMGEELTLVDCPDAPLPLSEPARILLASDGVQTLSDDDIANIMRGAAALDADACAARLLQAVEDKQHPRQDNTTIMVYDPPSAATVIPAVR